MELTAVLTHAEEGGYVALNPETGTTTQGETVEEAVANLQEAAALYLSEFPMPSTVVRQLGLRDGDTVHAQVMADGALAIRAAGWSRASFAAELDQARAALPMGASVIEALRGAARY